MPSDITISEDGRNIYTRHEGTEKVMKENGSKPIGRLKSMVDVSSARLVDKLVADFNSVSNGKQMATTNRQGKIGQEDSAAHCRDVSRQVLPDRVRTCVQKKAVNRIFGLEKTASRPCGFEKSVNKPKLEAAASRFEDKFPRKQPVSHEAPIGVESLSQRTRKDGCSTNQHPKFEKPTVRSSLNRETTNTRTGMHDRIGQQETSQRRHHEKVTKDQCYHQKTKGTQQDDTMGTKISAKGSQAHQRQPILSREKFSKKTEQIPTRHGVMGESVFIPDRHDKLPVHMQRMKSHIQDRQMGTHDRLLSQQTLSSLGPGNWEQGKLGTHDRLSSQQTLSSQWGWDDETDIEDMSSLESQRHLPLHSREFQEPAKDRVSAHSQRHPPWISETHSSHGRTPFQRQPPERLVTAHEHETKLIQRQQYLQEKVRSRKMLLGSVIPSDMTFSSEACRNWQSATLLSYRYREEKSYKHMVLSADSGISMGEGSSASLRNSETETDDQAKDDLPTIIAEVGEIVNRRVPTKCQKCQRNRCEMKDASSQHSHPPSETGSPPSSPCTESIASEKLDSTAIDVMSPPPRDRVYQCRVIRDKNTYGTMFYPVYRMYLERDGRPEMLLLTARKRKKCSTSKYLICTGNDELRRNSSSLVGKLRSNLVGTRFHLATYVKEVEPGDDGSRPLSPLKFDSLLLFYETNFLGAKGPRRMKVFLPELGRSDVRLNLLERVRDGSMDGVLSLVNKEPEWDRETLSHILYFEGRVTKSSVKNFQLVEPPDESSVLLQFGKVGRNEFTLDYHPPINAVQAFAIALSSFDGKIACE